MARTRVFLTGATGGMGYAGLKELLKAGGDWDIVILARDSQKNRTLLAPYGDKSGLSIVWGDLANYKDVYKCVEQSDIVLHVGALVSPEADKYPQRAMEVNYGSTCNIIEAIRAQGRQDQVKLVYIGTIAETGDRMPPIHWGRVGDPIKPSVFDYYAVSKIAAERAVIESGLKYWVSLRQTGILSEKMSKIEDPIMFHNCLDNVLEYVSEPDSAVMLRNICAGVSEDFWGHIYNIGGGKDMRLSCADMYQELFGQLGITELSNALDSKWFALRNFHGHYYLDSDKLEEFLHFRSHDFRWYVDLYLKQMGKGAAIMRFICKLPGGQKMIGNSMKKRFLALASGERGTMNFISSDNKDAIAAYFISKEVWDKIPPLEAFQHFKDWDTVVRIDHGYDETKPESTLSLDDMKKAAEFRGGKCLSGSMEKGDWNTKLSFKCAFGHTFEASPRLVLEGGHWCDECERQSWNYHEIAKVNPFFAQVWNPLHDKSEASHTYPKKISEKGIKLDFTL